VVLWEAKEATRVLKKGHTEEHILRALRQAESGTRAVSIIIRNSPPLYHLKVPLSLI